MGNNTSSNVQQSVDCTGNQSSSEGSSYLTTSNNKDLHNFESLTLDSTSDSSSNYISLSSQYSTQQQSSTNILSSSTVFSVLSSNNLINNNNNNIDNNAHLKHINNNKNNNNNEYEIYDDDVEPLILNDLLSDTITSSIYSAKFEGKQCIVKAIKRDNIRAKELFINETNALNILKHENIIQSYGITKDKEYYYIILDEGDIDLADFRGEYKLTEKHVSILIKNILLALKYMHSKNICHRDLKPENILLKNNDYHKPIIIDFGECLKLKNNNKFYENILVGTANYLSPERLLFDSLNNNMFKSSDLWSVGVICYELITGKHAFNGKTNDDIYQNIVKNNWKWPKNVKVSKLCKNFVANCLQYDASKRMTVEQALTHDFLN